MKLIIKDNYDQICEITAEYIMKKINSCQKEFFVLGLPTGSTPLGVYKKLIEYYNQGILSFKKVITFNMDEYVGLNPQNENSYDYFMKSNFFNFIDIPEENINLLNGVANDLNQECINYEEKIKKYPIDLFLCGIGSDGHMAFNEPGSSLNSVTRVKTLCYETIESNGRFFNDYNLVPTQALTVGIKTIMDAKEVIMLASGRKKALAIKNIIEEPISSQWTASKLQEHPKCMILCDKAATDELKVKTVRYFKNLEFNSKINGDVYIDCIKQFINKDDKILITSPHPDDDIIGCGGLMQSLNKENVKILYMTSGKGGLSDKVNYSRYYEALSSLTLLGYQEKNMEQISFPFYQKEDRKISEEDINEFEKVLQDYKPNHIFVCCDVDPKKTHLKCFNIIKSSNMVDSVKNIWFYKGAWDNWDNKNSKFQSNAYLNLNKHEFDNKLNALKMHLSQHPLKVNDELSKDLIERCFDVTTGDFGRIQEKFMVLNKNEYSNLCI